jgi:hypothetical protein
VTVGGSDGKLKSRADDLIENSLILGGRFVYFDPLQSER